MYLANKIQLSSSLTSLYKTIIPIVLIACNFLLWLLIAFVFPPKYMDLYVVVIPVWVLFSVLLIYPLVQIKHVFMDSEGLYISSKGNIHNVAFANILTVSRFMNSFYKIRYSTTEKIDAVIVMPRMRDVFPTLGFVWPDGFKKLKQISEERKSDMDI